jgi:NAD-dependent SIR2 family protein deacetylase
MFTNKLLARLRDASSMTVLTGAGISAESGVPTFRGKDGLWQNHKAEELATVNALEKKSPTLLAILFMAAGGVERRKAQPGALCPGRF